MPSIVIIGAGMSGLCAARVLESAGWHVTLLDKGRGVGGRMATRRIGNATFDHGAQYFTVRDPAFSALVEGWLAAGTAQTWAQGFPHADGASTGGSHPRYVGAQGMNSLPKAIGATLKNVQTSIQVTRLSVTSATWTVHATDLTTQAARTYTADALLMTPPAEQSLTLLGTLNAPVPTPITDALSAITYEPCFALLIALDRPAQVPAPGGVFMDGEPIAWLADNAQKGISAAPALTVHASAAFTRAHYDDDKAAVSAQLLAAVQPYLGDAQVLETQLHRWRYSQPRDMHPQKTLFSAHPAPLAFAGDAFDGARVEGAALSGLAAAETLIREVK